MRNSLKILLGVCLIIAILVASFFLYKNIKRNNKAASYSENNLGMEVSELQKDKSLDQLYKEINEYIEKVEKIGQEANTKENHSNINKIKEFIKQLEDIEKDIEENHQDFQGHDSYVLLMNYINDGKVALNNQITLLELPENYKGNK